MAKFCENCGSEIKEGADTCLIWGLIEGILILTGSIHVDAEGNELGD